MLWHILHEADVELTTSSILTPSSTDRSSSRIVPAKVLALISAPITGVYKLEAPATYQIASMFKRVVYLLLYFQLQLFCCCLSSLVAGCNAHLSFSKHIKQLTPLKLRLSFRQNLAVSLPIHKIYRVETQKQGKYFPKKARCCVGGGTVNEIRIIDDRVHKVGWWLP